jgi:hypothetical protein
LTEEQQQHPTEKGISDKYIDLVVDITERLWRQ